jgi:hypothetical protein
MVMEAKRPHHRDEKRAEDISRTMVTEAKRPYQAGSGPLTATQRGFLIILYLVRGCAISGHRRNKAMSKMLSEDGAKALVSL